MGSKNKRFTAKNLRQLSSGAAAIGVVLLVLGIATFIMQYSGIGMALIICGVVAISLGVLIGFYYPIYEALINIRNLLASIDEQLKS